MYEFIDKCLTSSSNNCFSNDFVNKKFSDLAVNSHTDVEPLEDVAIQLKSYDMHMDTIKTYDTVYTEKITMQ